MKKMIAFDLDGTLAESKQAIAPPMAALLKSLLDVASVAVISGGNWPQFETQVVDQLPVGTNLTRLYIMPTTGTKLYRYDGSWRLVYAEIFEESLSKAIIAALEKVSASLLQNGSEIWGDQIENRGSQITFSGLGQQAPLAAKKAWDPDMAKRKALQSALRKLLPDLSINVGGATSIDITKKGIDKAYGMRRLSEHSKMTFDEILFLGDAIFPGGNDDPVRAAGIDTVAVRDVAESMSVVRAIIACLKSPTSASAVLSDPSTL